MNKVKFISKKTNLCIGIRLVYFPIVPQIEKLAKVCIYTHVSVTLHDVVVSIPEQRSEVHL